MNEYQYFEMLIVGLRENKKFLPQYLIREQKKAEKDFIEFNEFIDRTICVIETMESDIRLLYHDRAKDNEIRKEITLWDYTVRLSKLANNQFEGDIGFKHTSLLRQAINDAFEFYREENDQYELVHYGGVKKPDSNRDKKINTEDYNNSDNGKHTQIFNRNGYIIWKLLFSDLHIVESSRTDLRFMYEIMKYHNLIYSTVSVTNFTKWINLTYEFSIDKLPFTDIKSNSNIKRMLIFNHLKQANPL